jgi:hypothetical protein
MSPPLPQRRTRKPSFKTRLDAGLEVLQARGLNPCAIDELPTGTIRYHLSPPANPEIEKDLDRELAEVMAKL